MNKIVLASKSPRRIELLTKAGFDVIVMPANIEEYVEPGLPAEDVVKSLALQKAKAVKESLINKMSDSQDLHKSPAEIELNTPIIAADTIVYLDEIIGKPADRLDAQKILMHLSGKEHQVYTGVAMLSLHNDEEVVFSEKTSVFFKAYSLDDLTEYLDTDEPYDKAGAYAIQGYFGKFIDHIDGDYSNVMGLPVDSVIQHLQED